MLYRTILLMFAALGLIQQAVGENRSVFECKYVRPSELMRAYAPAVAKEAGARIREEGRKVLVTGGSSRLHERLRELEFVVDLPKIKVATGFIRLHHFDVTFAAALVSEAFTHDGKQKDALQVVPSPRTKQVFVMGELKDMRTAEVLLLKLDRFRASANRGWGGWRMLGWAGFN